MRRTVEWSYSLLDAQERTAFDRLSVFAGSFDAAAASTVVSDGEVGRWEVVDALASLVAKSMLGAEPGDDGTTRFVLLETLREFARERLREGGDIGWRRKHAEFYVSFAEDLSRQLVGRGELEARRRIRAELDNLRAAVAWGLDSGDDDAELSLRIIAALVYQVIADLSSGVGAWAEQAVHAAERAAPIFIRQSSQPGRGARTHAGTTRLPEPLAVAGVQPDLVEDCHVPDLLFSCLGLVTIQAGRPDEALQVMLDAAPIVDVPAVTPRARADYHTFTAFSAVRAGAESIARAHIEEAIRLADLSGNPSLRAHALAIFGNVQRDLDPAATLAALDESVELSQSGASDFAMSTALYTAAQLRAQAGQTIRAVAELRDAVVRDYQRGSLPSLLSTLNMGVDVLARLGFCEPAGVLLGAVIGGPMAPLVAPRLPSTGGGVTEEQVLRLRAALGSEQYDFAVACGAAMSYQDLVRYVLEELTSIAAGTRTHT